MLVTIIISFIVISLTYYLIKWKQMRKISEKFAGPKPIPFFGNLLEYKNDPKAIFDQLMNWNNLYGKAVALHGFGLLWDILITDPKDIELILSKGKASRKSFVYNYFTQWLGKIFVLNFIIFFFFFEH